MLSGSVLAVSLFFSQIMMIVQLYKYKCAKRPARLQAPAGAGLLGTGATQGHGVHFKEHRWQSTQHPTYFVNCIFFAGEFHVFPKTNNEMIM